MFEGDKDKLLLALDMIKQTYLSLMTTIAVQIEDREQLLRNLYEAKIELLESKLDAFKVEKDTKLSTFARFEEENKQLFVKLSDLEVQSKLDAQEIANLKRKNERLHAVDQDYKGLQAEQNKLVVSEAKLAAECVSLQKELADMQTFKNEAFKKQTALEKEIAKQQKKIDELYEQLLEAGTELKYPLLKPNNYKLINT